MSWLYFAILAPIVSSLVSCIDKYLVNSGSIDYRTMPLYSAVTNSILATFAWAAYSFPVISGRDTAMTMAVGMIYIVVSVLYFDVLKEVPVSKLLILLQALPVMVLGLSAVFLQEDLNVQQIIGFFVILTACIGLIQASGLKKPKEQGSGDLVAEKGIPAISFIKIMLCNLLWAVAVIILKIVTGHNSVMEIYIFQSWGIGLGGLLLCLARPDYRKALVKGPASLTSLSFNLLLLDQALSLTGRIISFYALRGPVTAVTVLGSTQVFFGILFGRTLSRVAPRIFMEDTSNRGLLREVLLALGMFAGIWLLQ
ncbi:MAG TPA: EamA family transporter [Bacillota bacterium]|nr:EamA family transporter [Bacillota bacterium]